MIRSDWAGSSGPDKHYANSRQAPGEHEMYQRIVVAIDGSELSDKAFRHALGLAGQLKAKLIAVTVSDPSLILTSGTEMMQVNTTTVINELNRAKEEGAAKILGAAKEAAAAAGQPI